MQVSASPAALEVRNVTHFYGKRKALDNVSFNVAPGTFTVLLGLNGAGKSTLFSLVTRLYVTRTGTIKIFGYDVSRESGEALRRLGVVFQARTLDLELSVTQNLIYHAALHGIGAVRSQAPHGRCPDARRSRRSRQGKSAQSLRRSHPPRRDRPSLSASAAIAAAREPTVGLDIKARADIIAQVRSLIAIDGVGVLWTTHLIDEIALTNSVVVLHQGKVLDQGIASEILARTGSPDMRSAFVKITGADISQGVAP